MRGRRWMMTGLGLVVALGMSACGGTVETGGSSSTSGSGGSSSTSGSSSSSSSGSVSTGAGGGAPCGGFGGLTCAADELCDYFDDLCGGNDGSGVCVKRPMSCTKELNPTCACNGMVYNNPCEANAAGQDISNAGMCPAPAGSFSCGAHFCAKGAQYCQHTPSDVGNSPDSNTCIAVPAACGGMPSCACLAGEPCGNMCSTTPGGGIVITCPGG